MNKKQSGSAHLVIIIALSAALLGAVGYIFWQNYNQANTEEVSVISKGKNIDITEWGITGVYSGDYALQYRINTDKDYGGDIAATFSSDELTGDCKNSTLATILRYDGSESLSDTFYSWTTESGTIADTYDKLGGRKIGDHYYFYEGAQDACALEDGSFLESGVIGGVNDYFDALKEM